jgi:hypothetical protein
MANGNRLSAVQIVEVRGRRDLKRFVRLPYTVYRGDPLWVAPLLIDLKKMFDPRRSPFLEHGSITPFLALRDGQVVGRIAAITNGQYNTFHGVNEGFWGYFECLDDRDAAARLFDHVADWFRQRGVRTVYGPVSPSINHETGILVDGFDSSPMVIMSYNPRYYVDLVEGYGMEKVRDMYAYRGHEGEVMPPRVSRLAERIQRRAGYTFRPFDLSRLDEDVAQMREIFNEAWSGNWGFQPFTEAEFREVAEGLKQFAIPELCPVVEHQGRLVAFLIAVPDVNAALKHARGRLFPIGLLKILWYKPKIDYLRVVVVGVRRDYLASGVMAGLYHHFIKRMFASRYRWCEMSWVLEDNPFRQMLEQFGTTIYKTYRVYRLPV